VILDSGHTAWMIVATLLVFMMTIPGIALFYGGLVRQKNMLSLVMQSLAIAGVVSILWVVFGYSLAFGTGYEGSGFFKYGIGGFDKVMLNGIGLDTLTATGIPEMLFVMFQCMFALITPALILGAFAEREVRRFLVLHGVVEHTGLHAHGSLGMGWRFPDGNGSRGLCRGHGGTCQCRRGRIGDGAYGRPS